MSDNVKILIWIGFGGIYIIAFLLYELLTTNHKKRFNSLYIIGVAIIIYQLMCYFFKELLSIQIMMNLIIIAFFPVVYSFLKKLE